MEFDRIKFNRAVRSLYNVLGAVSIATLIDDVALRGYHSKLALMPPPRNVRIGLSTTTIGISIGAGVILARVIQNIHGKLADEIKFHGLISPQFEQFYPHSWVNPTIVAQTHPIFHVKSNGDLVFHRPTREEFARLKFQEKFFGKIGWHPWRWRATLRMPEASEIIKKRTAERVKAWARQFIPQPIPRPNTAFATKRSQLTRPKNRRRQRK